MRQLTQAGKTERNNWTQLNLRDSLYLIRDYNWLKLCIPSFWGCAAIQIWIWDKTVRDGKIFTIRIQLDIIRDISQITRIFVITVDVMMTSIFQKGLLFKTNKLSEILFAFWVLKSNYILHISSSLTVHLLSS